MSSTNNTNHNHEHPPSNTNTGYPNYVNSHTNSNQTNKNENNHIAAAATATASEPPSLSAPLTVSSPRPLLAAHDVAGMDRPSVASAAHSKRHPGGWLPEQAS